MALPALYHTLSTTHKNEFLRLIDDPEYAATKIGYVIPGATAGAPIPFVPTPPQKHIFQTIREIQAFRFVEQARHLPKTEKKEAWALIWNRQHVPSAPDFRAAWERALEFGPSKAIRLLNDITGTTLTDAVRLLLGKPRQFGGTTVATWLAAARAVLIENHLAFIVAHLDDASKDGLDKVRRFFDYWAAGPHAWCFPGYAGHRSDAILSLANGSKVEVRTAGGKDIRAPKADFLELSEFAHYDTNKAVNAIAIAIQDHCWSIKDSTANGVGGQFYTDWNGALYVKDAVEMFNSRQYPEKWNREFRCFVAWWEDPRYTATVEEGEEEQILAGLTEYERAWRERLTPDVMTVGRIKWRRQKVTTANDPTLTPEQKVLQEFPGDDAEMFQASGTKPFGAQRIIDAMAVAATWRDKARHLRQQDIGAAETSNAVSANLTIWRRPKKGAKYVIGADVAMGLAHGDRSWAVVLERVDGTVRRQVAEWRGHIGQKAFGHVLALLGEFYNDAFLVPETNAGLTAVTALVDEIHYPNIYQRQPVGRVGEHEAGNAWYAGFLTSGSATGSRPTLLNELIYGFENGHIEVLSEPLLAEMSIFSRNEKGRMEAPPGQHDDGVFALALANWGDSLLRGAPELIDRAAAARPVQPEEIDDGLSRHDRNLIAACVKEEKVLRERSLKLQKRAWWL